MSIGNGQKFVKAKPDHMDRVFCRLIAGNVSLVDAWRTAYGDYSCSKADAVYHALIRLNAAHIADHLLNLVAEESPSAA